MSTRNYGPGNGKSVNVSRATDEKLCPYRGCAEIISATARGCSAHKNLLSEAENERRRNHPRNLIYRDPRWRAVRRFVKQRDNWTCQKCGHFDLSGRTLSADHANEGGVLNCPDPFDPMYIVTLCMVCSGRKDGARGNSSKKKNDGT